MKVNTEDRVLCINWKHNREGKKKGTLCRIMIPKQEVPIAVATTILHKGDTYDKNKGRKESLKRAIIIAKEQNLITRADSTRIWATYAQSIANPYDI